MGTCAKPNYSEGKTYPCGRCWVEEQVRDTSTVVVAEDEDQKKRFFSLGLTPNSSDIVLAIAPPLLDSSQRQIRSISR